MTKIIDFDGELILADDLNMGLIWAEAALSELTCPPNLDAEPATCVDCGAPAVEGEEFCAACLAQMDQDEIEAAMVAEEVL
jgi:hypothetical protein